MESNLVIYYGKLLGSNKGCCYSDVFRGSGYWILDNYEVFHE